VIIGLAVFRLQAGRKGWVLLARIGSTCSDYGPRKHFHISLSSLQLPPIVRARSANLGPGFIEAIENGLRKRSLFTVYAVLLDLLSAAGSDDDTILRG